MEPGVIYVVGGAASSRGVLVTALAAIGWEAWPFSSVPHFLTMIEGLQPSCILICGDNSNFHGLGALRELRDRGVSWPAVVTSDYSDIRTAVDAAKLGATDFLQTPADEERLADALTAALAALQLMDTTPSTDPAGARVRLLTPREVEVATTLITGRSNKAAAYELGISARTVEMHRANILRKLGVRNLAEGAVLLTRAQGTAGTKPRP